MHLEMKNHGATFGVELVPDRFGNDSSAYYFDGDRDYISVPFSGSLKIEGDISINLWVNHEDADNYIIKLIHTPNSYYDIYTEERLDGNGYHLLGRASGYRTYNSNITNQNGKWNMITFVSVLLEESLDSGQSKISRRYEWYVDGKLQNAFIASDDGRNLEDGVLLIGASSYDNFGSETTEFFKGKMDDIRIYNKSLSNDEVEKIYENEKTNEISGSIIVVPAGSLSAERYLFPLDDNVYESYESVSLKLDTAYNGKVSSLYPSDIVIEDNDLAPEVSISSDNDFIGEVERFNTNKITATLTNPVSLPVSVPLLITGDVDTADYILSSEEITILPGDLEGSITITSVADSILEGNEKMIIRAVDVKNASDTVKQVISVIITENVCDFIDTDISGNVFEDLTLYNICTPYTIIGDLIIANGATLTIEPGVEIEFEGPHNIEVIDGGKLIAKGTEQDSITISGIAWGGIDIRTPGSEIQYAKIIEEGNSSSNGYILRLVGSHIDRSHIFGGTSGIYLNDSSIVSRSKIHDIRQEAIGAHNRSLAYGNIIYDVGINMNHSAAVKAYSNSYVINNKIYSTLEDPNMIAVSADWGAEIKGNTIGSDKGIHGKFGIFINGGGNDIRIQGNRIGGFKTNVVYIGARPTFKDNTFMGELDQDNKHMNVRIASGNMTQENQNYPQYLSNNNYWGSGYGVDRIDIDMTENYWSNVRSNEIESFIYDFIDRGDLIGDVNFSNQLTKPSSDAPISPPRNVIKLVHPNGVEFKWTPNEEEDLEGYKVYYDKDENGIFKNSADLGNVTSHVLVGGNVNNTYYLTAYDTIADGVDDQIEGHESWFADPAASVEVSLHTDNNVISELEQFNSTVVTVELSSTYPEDLTIELDTRGAAELGSDYDLTPSSVTIESGTLSSDVVVTAIADENDNEEDEIIELLISNNSSVNLGINSSVSINIASDICEFIPNSLSGPIEEDLTLYNLCNPYYITGNIVVREGVTLTIEPGVTVVFSPQTYMSVNGKLIAEGTEQDSITFTGNGWNDINIQGSSRGSSLKYVSITDISGTDSDWKLRLRNGVISNSEIFNVGNGIYLTDSASVEYSVLRDIKYKAIDAEGASTIYGNRIYNVLNKSSNGNSTISIRNYSVFRNNIIGQINGGSAALEVGYNSIVLENIIGDYSGHQGHVGILVRQGNNQTIRNNKVGGFTANVVLIGTKPTFARNSFIGELNYQNEDFNVVVGNNNLSISDSARYDVNFWGWSYGQENEIVNMRSNYWQNVPEQNIEISIWDYKDEIERRGEINYDNNLSVPDDDTPITPPRGLEITETSLNNYSLSWIENPENDVVGYYVYTGLNLENKVDVGSSTQTSIEIPDVNTFNIGVTAYDTEADGENDMIEGHESLPSRDYVLNTIPRAVDDTLRVPINSSITLDEYPESESINIAFDFGKTFESLDKKFVAEPSTTTNNNMVLILVI